MLNGGLCPPGVMTGRIFSFIIHHSSFIIVFLFLVSACGQPQKKPFSNPRLYADPPPAASPARPAASAPTPVIAFASSNMDKAGIGWAGRVEYTARATASRDVEYSLLQDWGHLDVLLGTAAAQQVFAPLADWIDRHTLASSP